MAQELVEFRPRIFTILPTDTTDACLVELWLHDLAITTQESYHIDIQALFPQRPFEMFPDAFIVKHPEIVIDRQPRRLLTRQIPPSASCSLCVKNSIED